jgi:hypothetical protein
VSTLDVGCAFQVCDCARNARDAVDRTRGEPVARGSGAQQVRSVLTEHAEAL